MVSANTLLCGKRGTPDAVTVADYEAWELQPDHGWSKKPSFIRRRLSERYIDPVLALDLDENAAQKKNGFYVMAVSCLLIETLVSFWRGWETTEPHKNLRGKKVTGRSRRAFRLFFRVQPRFSALRGTEFYKRVRCGILHQGETTAGWRILRTGPLFDGASTINAIKFHKQLWLALDDYVCDLQKLSTGSNLRRNFDKKMRAVIANCKPIP